nr:uncharacterized protein LOC126527410 [Dermacentor andersoni]
MARIIARKSAWNSEGNFPAWCYMLCLLLLKLETVGIGPEDTAMPHHGQGRLYRFRDHAVAGANWRPTRFVDEVPNSRVCGLCLTIPRRMLLLPCHHGLCQSCHAAIIQVAHRRCPLDQEPFEQVECHGVDFAARNRSLKVYCWNEDHGCEYTGTMDRMLEHYEKECTFHAVKCARCGEGLLQKDLTTHYVAGCNARVSTATEYPSSEPTALTLEEDSAALEDLKSMLGYLNDDQLLLPVLQAPLNEFTEEVRNQKARLAEMTRELVACDQNFKNEMGEIDATISSIESRLLTFHQNPAEEVRMSSLRSFGSEVAIVLRMLQCVAEVLIMSFIITKAITFVIYTHE